MCFAICRFSQVRFISFRRLKDLLDFTCMIADKFSNDAKVKLTLFQKIGQKRFGVYAIVKTDDGVDAETFLPDFLE